MKNLQAYREQLQELSQMLDRLERGELSIQELVEMEQLTAGLHAKSVILRYKAFEAKVHGEESPIVEEVPEEEVHDLIEEETPEEESPAIEFSIFSEEEEEEEDEAPLFEPTAEEEEEYVAEEFTVVEPVVLHLVEEKEEEEEPVMETPQAPKAPAAPASGTSFWEQVKAEDNSLGSRFAGSKIDTLIGAFGLNEKLRFINDLFDGSSELFSDAVKMLDAQADFNAATLKVNELASEHSWDPEEESVAEFMIYVKRRYA